MTKFQNFDDTYPYNYIINSVGLLISLVGIFISTSVLLILLRKNWKRLNIDLQLVVLTLCFDISSGLYCMVNSICNLVKNTFFIDTILKCNINATTGIIVAATSFNTVGVIAVERCLLVVYDFQLKRRYYFIILSFLLSLNFLSILICCLYNGFGQVATGVYCMFDLDEIGGKVGSIILGISCLISISMVYTSYILIILKRRSRLRKLQSELGPHCGRITQKKNTTLVKSLSVIIVSSFTNLPYCIVTIMSVIEPSFYTPLVDSIATTCIMLNQILNTILLLHMRPDVFAELKEKLGWMNLDVSFTANVNSGSNTTPSS